MKIVELYFLVGLVIEIIAVCVAAKIISKEQGYAFTEAISRFYDTGHAVCDAISAVIVAILWPLVLFKVAKIMIRGCSQKELERVDKFLNDPRFQ